MTAFGGARARIATAILGVAAGLALGLATRQDGHYHLFAGEARFHRHAHLGVHEHETPDKGEELPDPRRDPDRDEPRSRYVAAPALHAPPASVSFAVVPPPRRIVGIEPPSAVLPASTTTLLSRSPRGPPA